ncbi:hypothetical protein [uncultured Methanobrevibacter sp.]|uniref:hypothetical protein n=1 Tax=uncultured Methanobrevibacter sp. TaxID=253161 RepID=UPI002623C3C1
MKFSFKMDLIFILSFALLLSLSSVSALDIGGNDSIIDDESFIVCNDEGNYNLDFNPADLEDFSAGEDFSIEEDFSTEEDFNAGEDFSIEEDFSTGEDFSTDLKNKNKVSSSVSLNGGSFEDIQSAIDNANDNDTIVLSGTFISSGERITVNKTLSIESSSAAVLDGNQSSQIFFIVSDNVVLKGLTLKNGITLDDEPRTDYKGAISWAGDNGTVYNCSFINNKAYSKGYGAAIRVSQSIHVENSSFINNSGFKAGAIFLSGSSNSIVNGCVFINNSANESGAIYCGQSNSLFSNNIFEGNTADSAGGAVSWCGSNGFIINNTFVNNTAGTKGGAICFTGSGNSVNGSIFANNSASEGGAIHSDKYLSYVENSIFDNNHANLASVFYGESFYMNNNFYGIDYSSSDEIRGAGLIYNGVSNQGVSNWVNLISSFDLVYSVLSPINVDNLIYKSSNGVFVSMPEYEFGISNDKSGNSFSSDIFTVSNEKRIQYIPSVKTNDTAHIYSFLSGKKILDFPILFIGQLDIDDNGTGDNSSDDNGTGGGSSDINGTAGENGTGANSTENGTDTNGTDTNATENSTDTNATDNSTDTNSSEGNITKTPSLSISVPDVYEGHRPVLYINLTYGETKLNGVKLSCVVDDFTCQIEVYNGFSTFSLPIFDIGSYDLSIDFAGNDEYLPVSASTVFNVLSGSPSEDPDENVTVKESPILIAFGSQELYSRNASLSILFFNVAGNYLDADLIIKIDDMEEKISIIDGHANLYYSDLSVGTHEVSVIFNGSNRYDYVDANTTIIVDRMGTVIEYENMTTASINYLIDGRKGDYFNVTLKDQYGNPLANKPVQIGFNGHIYTPVTDNDGKASIQINLAVSGNYTFAICFLSDDGYYASFEVAKITVNKQTPKLTTSNKSYRITAKSKKITATFKTSRGTALRNKKISFTVNGKTYTAKTNSKGIASVNVSLSKKKTYAFTVKYAGDDVYKAISKSGKIVIR